MNDHQEPSPEAAPTREMSPASVWWHSRRVRIMLTGSLCLLGAGFAVVAAFRGALVLPTLGTISVFSGGVLVFGGLFHMTAFLAQNRLERLIISGAGALGIGTLFPFGWSVLAVIVGSGLFFKVADSIGRERDRGLTLSASRVLGAGRSLFVLTLSIALSVGYFFSVKDLSWESIASRLSIGKQTSALVLGAVAYFKPEWAGLASETATVDDFLTAQWNERTGGTALALPAGLEERIAELERAGVVIKLNEAFLADTDASARAVFLESGRAELGTLTGHPLTGRESMASVLSEGIERRILLVFRSPEFQERVPERALPLTLSLLFFLTVSPLLAVVATLWETLAALLVAALVRAGALRVGRRPAVQEFLAD